MIKIFIVLSLTLVHLVSCDTEYTKILQLKHGKIRGLIKNSGDGKKVEFYEGIKFGEAARFEKPQPAHPWSEVKDATSMRNACIQFGSVADLYPNVSFSEDCLYLNVWRPTEVKTNRAVMVWIYGGGFEAGTIFTSVYDGQYIAAQGDVIVVAINYRLGPFGFISGGGVPSNLGLYDQILGLKWVQENIHYFGGDPQKVTIFGESAGSVATGALVISPLAKGLFKRAIGQSGAPNRAAFTDSMPRSLERTKTFAKKLKCPIDANLKETIHCIKGKSVAELQKATTNDMALNELFLPVYGDEVLPIKPSVALKEGKFNKVDYIYGVNRDEGTYFVPLFFPELVKPVTNLTSQSTKEYIVKMMTLYGEANIGKKVADFYVDKLHNATQEDLLMAIANVWGDSNLVCPSVLFGEELAKHSPNSSHIYAYRLMQATPVPFVPMVLPKWIESSVYHGSDLFFLFFAQIAKTFSAAHDLSSYMIKSWTEFAKTGRPNAKWNEAVNRKAKDFNTSYMHLEAGHYKMVEGYFKEVCDQFWKPLIE